MNRYSLDLTFKARTTMNIEVEKGEDLRQTINEVMDILIKELEDVRFTDSELVLNNIVPVISYEYAPLDKED